MVNRSGVPVVTHQVREIQRQGADYIIDGQYRCRYLVGAGGSHCPVYHTFFRQIKPRIKEQLVATLEKEFPYDVQDANCHLWFFENNLPGYAWYVPKSNGYLNIGIGGYSSKLKANNDAINRQWYYFTRELERRALIKDHSFHGKGSVYYIRNDVKAVQIDRLFLIGDAAGLATKDMGEGIDPAITSGMLAADAIVSNKEYSLRSLKKFSFPRYRTAAVLMWNYWLQHRRKNV
jgi:flavin-dependent dehydrogenase